jgi:2-polyprenyl-6-methoxyphenol hydroxylase-like FAD-dependent oxidoreductase
MSRLGPSVAIVGGGIGGLFAANALLALGLRVAVYEQAQAIGEVGAGVFLTPNSVRHLFRIGLGGAIEDGMALATILAHASRATAPSALLAYERLRRGRVAKVQREARESGLRYDSAHSDLGVRDFEIAAHAAFRKRLYDYDVVPHAQAAAAPLA